MATDVGQGKSAPASKYENFVKAQLSRAESRIRTLDLTAALLGFAAGTLAYAVVVALLDHLLELPPVVRQGVWGVYLLASLVYLTAYVLLPLSRRINPYFAARQLERSLPGSKNSVVNWLDLRDENLPSAIRGAVGQRAARDLGQADLDKAVSARRAYWAGGVASLCCLGFLIALFTLGPAMFLARLGRTFAPFGANGASTVPTSTQLTIVKPVDGDAVVPDGRPIEIGVQVNGRVPDPKAADALKLLYRYEPSGPYQSRPLEQDDGGRWGATLAANEVQDGFWYKAAGGDGETKEYRVQRTPRIADFKAVYQFRPYLARVKETRLERKIEAVRGTQVDLTVHANRELKEGYLQFEGANGAKSVTRGEVLPDDMTGLHVRLTLDESGQYRICFTSMAGEDFVEQQPSPLIAVPDAAPVVVLTKPAELKEKPGFVPPLQADAVMALEGDATDDLGVAAMRLNLRVENGPTLPPREYRSGDKLKLPHGGNPVSVHYEDFVDLAKLKNPADPLFVVRPGMVLEYWLTAEDACDFPKPNVGESKHYRVQIVEPLNNDKVQDQQRKDEEAKKDDNEKKQDGQNQKEDAERQKKNQETESKNDQNAKGQQQEGSNGGKDDKPDDKGNTEKKPGDKGGQQQNPDNKGNTGSDNAKPPDNPNQPPKGGDKTNSANGQDGKDNVSQDLKDALNGQKKDQEGTGKSDPKQQPAGDGKDAGDKPKNDTADAKPGPQNQPGGQHDASAAKDQGQPDAHQPKEGEGKSGGDPKMQPDAKPGENKQGGDPKAQPDAQPGQGKENKADASAQPGGDKGGGKPEERQSAGGDKPQGDASTAKADKAESKESNSPDSTADARPAGDAKDKAAPETKAEAKGGGPENHDKDAEKSQAKADGTKSPMGDQKPAADAKSEGSKADKKDVAQRKSDGGGEGQPEPEEMKPQDVAELAKDLKSADPAKREEAAKKLQQVEQKAEDQQARKDAGKALDDAGVKSEDTQVAESKPLAGSNGPPTDDKSKEKPSESKTGMGDDPSLGGKETPTDNPKNDVAKGETKHGPTGDNKETKPGEAKGGPGNGALTRHGDPTQADNTTAPPASPEKPVAQKASVLQLRKFLDTVDKKVLEDAKRDPAAMKKLQEEARKWLAEHPPEGDGGPVGPQKGGALGSTAGSRSNPDGKTANDDPDNGGRPLPPPGYRDPYKEFTKLLSPGGDK